MDAETRRRAIEHFMAQGAITFARLDQFVADAVTEAVKEKVLQVASLMAQLAHQDEEIARLRAALEAIERYLADDPPARFTALEEAREALSHGR